MKIVLSPLAGFCFGVKRAVDMLETKIKEGRKNIYTLGRLIHNDDFLSQLEEKGVRSVEPDEIDSIPPDALVITRTHGITKEILAKLREKNVEFIDATCPFVSKIHSIVARENEKKDAFFLILGDARHPEVEGIVSYARDGGENNYFVFPDSAAFEKGAPSPDKIGEKRAILIAQTTQSTLEWKKCLEIAKKLYTSLTIFDTICDVTGSRQADASRIAAQVDAMLVIGGLNSSNTKKLVEICSHYCPTYHIENKNAAPQEALRYVSTVGITAGASTPEGIIKEVVESMSEETNTELSFAELLDQSFKTLNTGEIVTGTITNVTPGEIHVDLGVKHTGILPFDEVTDDNSFSLVDNFKVGDKVTVLLQKFSDAEGTVMLSKKRVDSLANWDKLVEASDSGEILEAKVVDAVRGGVIVSWKSMRVFIPASQSGVPKNGDINSLVGKNVKFKIIDLDPSRRRAVGSVRAVNRDIRKAAEEKIWSDIEIGKKYHGVVKSLTSYGAFVDIGGVDGMIHITELSWKRIKNPSEIVKVGEEVDVYVKDLNPEERKISLGYKNEADNPFSLFLANYKEGDKAAVKIVNIMPFGAFAEICDGVDGLIHISQISSEKIGKPEDVLSVGQVVDVIITEIDRENKKISLSIRALLEDAPEAEEASAPEASEEAPKKARRKKAEAETEPETEE